MQEVWGYRVCLVLCRSEELVESICRLGLVDILAWHSQRFVRKSGRYPFVHRRMISSILPSVFMSTPFSLIPNFAL